MKLLFNTVKLHQHRSTINITRRLINVHKYKFSETIQDTKSPEVSNLDNEFHPFLQSISQSKAYQSVKSDEPKKSQKRIHKKIRAISSGREQRILRADKRTSGKHDGMYADLYLVKSVSELRKLLSMYKQNKSITKQKSRKQNIMDILNSFSGDKQDDNTDNIEFNSNFKHFRLDEAYCRAIHVCGLLKEFDEGFKLFEEAKQDGRCISANVYGSVMWLHMEQQLGIGSLNKCFELFEEMKNVRQLKPSSSVYRELIANSIHVAHFKRASRLVHEILTQIDDSEKKRLLSGAHGKQLRHAILNYYAKRAEPENGLRFMNLLNKLFGNTIFDDELYSIMLNCLAIAAAKDKSLIDPAEKFFEQSFQVLSRAPSPAVFSSLLGVYASIRDFKSCVDLLKAMNENDEWPNPNERCFTAVLKGFTNLSNRVMDPVEGWDLANQIIDLMDKNIIQTPISYAFLFKLCGGAWCNKSDLDRLHKYYDEMITRNVPVTSWTLNGLLLSGIDHYAIEVRVNPDNKEKIKKEITEHINWVLELFENYNLKLNSSTEHLMHSKLNEVLES